MTALDPITAASPTYINAMRHGMKDGAPLQLMPTRINWTRWTASVLFGAFVGVMALLVDASDQTACTVGALAGLGVWLMAQVRS